MCTCWHLSSAGCLFRCQSQISRSRNVHAQDVYAFGVILWEMLSGVRPWHQVNMVAIAFNVSILRQRPPLNALSQGRCPPKLTALIESCWDHVPERRPASAEVVKRLALIQTVSKHVVSTGQCKDTWVPMQAHVLLPRAAVTLVLVRVRCDMPFSCLFVAVSPRTAYNSCLRAYKCRKPAGCCQI